VANQDLEEEQLLDDEGLILTYEQLKDKVKLKYGGSTLAE
jgi:hypothetical protein